MASARARICRLLSMDHVAVGVRVISVLRRAMGSRQRHRRSSGRQSDRRCEWSERIFPTPQSSSSNSNTNIFDLGDPTHVLLDRGDGVLQRSQEPLVRGPARSAIPVELRRRPTAAGISERCLIATAICNTETMRRSQHDLSAQFDARRVGMTLSKVTLKSGQSQLLLNASLHNYSQSQGSCRVHRHAGHGASCARS